MHENCGCIKCCARRIIEEITRKGKYSSDDEYLIELCTELILTEDL
jgi:hypothetical protein